MDIKLKVERHIRHEIRKKKKKATKNYLTEDEKEVGCNMQKKACTENTSEVCIKHFSVRKRLILY